MGAAPQQQSPVSGYSKPNPQPHSLPPRWDAPHSDALPGVAHSRAPPPRSELGSEALAHSLASHSNLPPHVMTSRSGPAVRMEAPQLKHEMHHVPQPSLPLPSPVATGPDEGLADGSNASTSTDEISELIEVWLPAAVLLLVPLAIVLRCIYVCVRRMRRRAGGAQIRGGAVRLSPRRQTVHRSGRRRLGADSPGGSQDSDGEGGECSLLKTSPNAGVVFDEDSDGVVVPSARVAPLRPADPARLRVVQF